MPRPYLQQTADCDPQSLLMSEAAVCRFLGTDGRGIQKLIKQQKLKRDPLTGSFARSQVVMVHDEILRELMGKDSPRSAYRTEPQLS